MFAERPSYKLLIGFFSTHRWEIIITFGECQYPVGGWAIDKTDPIVNKVIQVLATTIGLGVAYIETDFFSNTPVLFRNFDQLTASRLNSAYKVFLQLQSRHADASPNEIAQLAQALQSDNITNEDILADALITSATSLQNKIIASAVQKYLQQL